MPLDQELDLRGDLGVQPESQVRIDPVLDGGETLLLEPADLVLRERLARELDERRTSPTRQSLAQPRRPLPRLRAPSLRDELLETVEIETARLHMHDVAAGLALEDLSAEQPTDCVNLVLQGRPRGARRVVTPEQLD